jgi:hypothetical protein
MGALGVGAGYLIGRSANRQDERRVRGRYPQYG